MSIMDMLGFIFRFEEIRGRGAIPVSKVPFVDMIPFF